MCIGPIFTLILYDNLDPAWFAYGWVAVWLSGFFAVALAVPSAAMFFRNMWWCCGSRRKVFPGQAGWHDDVEQSCLPYHPANASFMTGTTKGGSSDSREQPPKAPEAMQLRLLPKRLMHEQSFESWNRPL
jgi:hypothetical protein